MPHSPDEGESVRLSPDDAFTLLGNETRIEILQALWERYDPHVDDNAVSFSDLYEQVDIEDTGNFNYHLGELVGHFVTETDDGYELAGPGSRIVRSIVAGTVTGDPTLAPSPLDVSCMRCDSSLEVLHRDGTTWVRCTECEGFWASGSGVILGFGLPPEGLRGRTPDEILDATIVYTLNRVTTMSDGVCPDCGGTVDASLTVCEAHDADDGICEACGEHFLGRITYVCSSCKNNFLTPSWEPLTHHPDVVAFYHDHGIDHVHNSWETIQRCFGWCEHLLSADPPRLRVTVPLEEDELHATLDTVYCTGWECYRHPRHEMDVYKMWNNGQVTYRCPTCKRRVRYKSRYGDVVLSKTKKGKQKHKPLPPGASVPGEV
jgi:ribosomal protein L37AE/L43A